MGEPDRSFGELVMSSLLAQKHALVNAFAALCEKKGGNIQEIMKLSKNFPEMDEDDMMASFGFEDATVEEDVKTLARMSEETKCFVPSGFWNRTLVYNDFRIRKFLADILRTTFYQLNDQKVAILGFVPRDPFRGTAAVRICKDLLEEQAWIHVYDPLATDDSLIREELRKAKCFDNVEEDRLKLFEDAYDATKGCSVIVTCSEAEEIKNLDFSKIFTEMEKPSYLIDGFCFLPHEDLKEIGFVVKSFGKNVDDDLPPDEI